MNTRIKHLYNYLNYIPEGKGIYLGDDTFLIGKALDGSDKLYGFIKIDNELLAVTRQCSSGYPLSDMDKKDLEYIFCLSQIHKKLKKKRYELVDANKV